MSDLISRQAVLDYPIRLDHYDEEHGNRHFVLGIESVMECVEYLPSADAVEVVRCKDCKYAHMTYGGECKYCDMWKEDGEALYLDGDFFCAYGERREP